MARSLFKELKSSPRKDVDEKWFNELILNKEDLLQNIFKSASITSNDDTFMYENTQDICNTQRSYLLG